MTLLAVLLGVAGLALAAALAASAHRPAAAPPDLAGYLGRWSQLHGGYDPGSARVTGTWLRLVYRLARPLAWADPDLLTVTGAWVAALVLLPVLAGGRWVLAGAAALAASGVLDSLDGAVAALTGRASPFGSVLDSLADRVADGVYLVALYLLGAPGRLCVAAAAAVVLLEYTRARAGAAGFAEVGVVTPGERPTRIVLTVLALAAAGAWPAQAEHAALAAAAAQTAIVTGSWLLLLWVVRRGLAGSPAGSAAGGDR